MAFLNLIAHPVFIEGYRNWGLRKKLIEELADRQGGSKAASANARRVLRAEKDRLPTIQIP